VDAYFNTMGLVRDPLRQQLFSDGFKRELPGWHASEIFHHHARRAETEDPLALIQYLDIHPYLPGDIHTKVDRASMAHRLEVRE
ncbi:asparagine synthase-related protein, partial [Klebsiella pneumoniae]|uniref:asparagine synthase-related protein n=1 Tax=Klebsiella pneumoniae TaxID=573 RepID=UPI0027309B54